MAYRIAVIQGDGIGPEVCEAALEVLQAVQDRVGLSLEIRSVEAGDDCYRRRGTALPADTVDTIKASDACLKGPVGETALDAVVRLRQIFDLYANVRPIKCYPKVECLRPGIDFVIVRENTEDLYRGMEFELDGVSVALRIITKRASARIAEYAFRSAESRNAKRSVVVVNKANVLRRTCGTFLMACREVAERHPSVTMSEMYVDAAAMNLIRRPQEFDVILTTNMFGDILSEEAAQLVGGLGLAPSGNIGDDLALFEPVHGSAPDIAGKRIANPLSMVLSAKMMLEWLGMVRNDPRCKEATRALDEAITRTLEKGVVTPDLGGKHGTKGVALEVAAQIKRG